jgi:pimeloyl-ACP methyl ester carboxylesterase
LAKTKAKEVSRQYGGWWQAPGGSGDQAAAEHGGRPAGWLSDRSIRLPGAGGCREDATMSERFVLPVEGCDLVGERWARSASPADASPTVVLLHEGVADRRGWHEVAGLLAPWATVVAYDRRGYGESPVSTSEFTNVGDLRAVLDGEKAERAWLVGASAGGGLALDAALLMPERVAGLVLIGSAVSGAPEAELDETEQGFDARFEAAIGAGDNGEINRLDTWFWLDGPYSPEGRVGGAARALALEMNAIIISNDAPDGAGDNGVDAWSRLAEITVPVTVACGALDAGFIRGRSRELARRLPKASYTELPGVAHQPYLEQPGAVADLIRDAIG